MELGVGMVIATRVSLGRVSGVDGVAILGKGVAASTPLTITSAGVASTITFAGVASTVTFAGVASEKASASSDGSLSTPQANRMNNDAVEMTTNMALIFILLLSMFPE